MAWGSDFQTRAAEIATGFMGDAGQGISVEHWLCEEHHPDAARPFINLALDWGLVGVEAAREAYLPDVAIVWIQDPTNSEVLPKWYYDVYLQEVPQASSEGADFCVEAVFTMAHPPR